MSVLLLALLILAVAIGSSIGTVTVIVMIWTRHENRQWEKTLKEWADKVHQKDL